MLFNSFNFLFFFLPSVLFVSARLRGQWLLAWITVCSFVFYAFAGHIWFIIPMLVTTLLDFFLAQKIAKMTAPWSKRALLFFSLCGNLGLLFYFKYASLLASSFSYLSQILFERQSNWGDIFTIILPAGISFYTFQTIAYIVDVYRGEAKPETNFWRFAGFVSFFPHLVAGPLTRHYQLLPALKTIEANGITPRWEEGIVLFVIGLSKKVLIADQIARNIDPIIMDIAHSGFVLSWLAVIGYALQIYFDFSGYSEMAIGLGRLFGIELPINFNHPYQATNPSDFWTRWHITLSRWLRDYLYIPLGGNRKGQASRYQNIMITMVLGGLWHGASWTFAIWGLYHGVLLVIYHATKSFWDRWTIFIQRTVTFICICLGWVFFRSKNFTEAGLWFVNLLGLNRSGLPLPGTDFFKLSSLVIIGLVIANLKFKISDPERLCSLTWFEQIGLGVLFVLTILFMNYSTRFLYFQF